MPPFVPLANGAQCDLLYGFDGVVQENRLWFVSRQPPIDQAQLDNLAAGVGEYFKAQLLPFQSNAILFRRVEARDWTADPPPFSSVHFIDVRGSGSSDCHSANVAIRIALKGTTDQTFPNNSNFVGGIPKDQVDLNRYSSTIKDAIFEAYAGLIDAAAVFGPFPAWKWVVTSRQLNNAWRTTQEFVDTSGLLFPSPFTSPRRRRIKS